MANDSEKNTCIKENICSYSSCKYIACDGSDLITHIATNHECSLCDKKYTRAGNLSRHITAFHLGVKRYVCERCGRRFAAKKELENHIKYIHLQEVRPSKYICVFCNKNFRVRSALNEHLIRLTWCGTTS